MNKYDFGCKDVQTVNRFTYTYTYTHYIICIYKEAVEKGQVDQVEVYKYDFGCKDVETVKNVC